jgi:hypothetical protein
MFAGSEFLGNLKDPVTALDYTVEKIFRKFPQEAGTISPPSTVADIKEQVKGIKNPEDQYERVLRYARFVVAECVPAERKIEVLATTTVAPLPAGSGSKEMLAHLIALYLR